MGWWRCCCGCLIHEDKFDRVDGIPLRGRWCEEEGDYEIDSGRAKSVVPGSIAILNVRHPVPEGSMIVSFVTKDEVADSGQKYRILLNVEKTSSGTPVVCSTSNYYFAEFERNGLLDSVIRLGVCSGGVETILKEDDIVGLVGFTRTFFAVITETVFCASVTDATLSLVATTGAGLFPEGFYSGFSLDTEDMFIDDFRFERHESKEGLCGSCICNCDGAEWPETLNVRVYPDPSNCVRLDLLEPCEFTIEWDRVSAVWIGSYTCCDGGQTWDIEVACTSGYVAAEDYLALNISVGCTSSCGDCTPVVVQDCDTMCATFGPFNVSATDLTCLCSSVPFDLMNPTARGSCNYYIEVCA